MKILYHHRIRSKDGQNVHVEELTAALRALGHEIVMTGPPAHARQEFGSGAGSVAWLKAVLPKAVYELAEYAYALVAYRRLRAAYLRHRPDVLYERYNLFLPAGLWLKRRHGLPMLSEVNAPLADERARFGGLALAGFARRVEARVWRGADYVLPVTDVLADVLRAAGVSEDRIQVIPNGIDPARFADAPEAEAAKRALGLDGRLVLGFTGFMRDWHRLERVVDFIADSDPALNLHFLLVGDGPVRAEIESRAAERGIADRVTFAGIVGRDRIAAHVAAFDIALQPAVVAYASPLKLFEYMVLGRAILAPDQPNIREVLTDGIDALLFDPDSPDGFPTALARLCADAELRAALGAGARRTIVEKGLTWESNARRVAALFDTLLKARRES
ncbi:MAG: glycosyltransferase family 4 protein [Alphaproteobacteria bacterium]